jgi:hypothetical protein
LQEGVLMGSTLPLPSRRCSRASRLYIDRFVSNVYNVCRIIDSESYRIDGFGTLPIAQSLSLASSRPMGEQINSYPREPD